MRSWYRIQYNIPLHQFVEMNIDDDVMLTDFYTRQYYHELRLGVRKNTDTSIDFAMPVFTMFRPYGGALPVPNGFGVDTTFTASIDKYKAEPTGAESQSNSDSDNEYIISRSTSRKMSDGSTQRTDFTEYKMDETEFESLIDNIDANNTDIWEDLETMIPGGGGEQ